MYMLKSLGHGRLLATFIRILPLLLRPLKFEKVSPLSQFRFQVVLYLQWMVL